MGFLPSAIDNEFIYDLLQVAGFEDTEDETNKNVFEVKDW